MTKNGRMQQVVMRMLAVMLVVSFLLASLSLVAQAFWVYEWREDSRSNYCTNCCPDNEGHQWTAIHYSLWRCWDTGSPCYDTGQDKTEHHDDGCTVWCGDKCQ